MHRIVPQILVGIHYGVSRQILPETGILKIAILLMGPGSLYSVQP